MEQDKEGWLNQPAAALLAWLTPKHDQYLAELTTLCEIESPSSDKAGVDAAINWVLAWATQRGWSTTLIPDAEVGNNLVIRLPGGNPQGARILLAVHVDTVYPLGTLAARPLRYEGDHLIGPGTADNKSGAISALYAMAALEELDLLGHLGGITLAIGSDEETHMRSSGKMLQQLAPEHDLALVLEAARANGDIVSARKGIGQWTIELFGRSAHAGVEPHKGAHAILALAHQISALQQLNGFRPGVTVNVGLIQGGSVLNAVPDYARLVVESRAVYPEDVEPIVAAIRQIAEHPVVPGVRASIHGSWDLAPMARSGAIAALADLAVECAAELGFELRDTATGGVSYANLLAGAGLPALDGLAPIGGQGHSPDEYLVVSSIVPRTALLALIMFRAQRGTL